MTYRRLIVFEGPDGAGKSTLAESLAASLNEEGLRAIVVHAGPPEGDGENHIFGMIHAALNEFKYHHVVIMDRSPLSEVIYGPILRGKVVGSDEEWELWDAVQQAAVGPFDVQMFCVDADDETLLQRAYVDRGEDFVPPEKFFAIVNAYREMHERLALAGWNIVKSKTK